jgi:putative flippase GtrA
MSTGKEYEVASSSPELLPVRMLRFGLLGVASFTANLGLTAFFHEVLRWRPEIAFAVPLAIVLALNFVACRHLVFEATGDDTGRQLLRFVLSSLGFRSAEWVAFVIIHSIAGLYYLSAVIVVLLVSFFVKFFFFRSVVFRA